MVVSEGSLFPGARNALKNIQDNSALIQRAQQRLSSGKMINSPLDNPTNFFAASSNINRATDLLSRKDGILEGIQTIRAGENGITAISSLLQSMKGIANAALATSDQNERDTYALNFTTLQKQITSLAIDSGYHGTNLLNGDTLTMEFSENTGGATLSVVGSDATADGIGVGYRVTAGTGGIAANQTATFSGIKAHQANVEFTDSFNVGDVSQTTIDATLQVFFNTNGKVPSTGTSMTLTATPTINNGLLTVTGTVNQDLPPPPIPLPPPKVGNVPTYTKISWGGNQERTFHSWTDSDNISVVYVDKVKQAGNYTINNNGDIVFNSAPLSGQSITLDKKSASVTWDASGAIQASLQQVDTAQDNVRNISSYLSTTLDIAATRLDFNSIAGNILLEGADNLTLADLNQESANLLMLQTRQSLGMTSIGLTSQAQRTILNLF